ncbi:MAG: hypothetical protein AW11_00733 [Candidatus Accumulibacter regalis]|uniref:Uncharacterized protein n=1 Tax=Accumulibacter regalis TaxID=522306 RepID=A0A011RH32_ACCRE|nr:ABC-three component system middle component 2 [Accumulibacter sp.]EXI90539.1 MAG: hypothetical protein AW11_00733 [Candidatus Accumulibacter regalis]HRE72639.1 threonine transporter [Accumulibacter sp.]
MRILFNTAMESSVRSLVVLTTIAEAVDLDVLVIYDYFLVHSGDYPGGPSSLHPPVPHRSGELLVRRDLVRAGLDYARKKGLVELCFAPDGVRYRATKIAQPFLSYFTTKYFLVVSKRARWIADELHRRPRGELLNLVDENLDVWGADTAQFLLVPGQ